MPFLLVALLAAVPDGGIPPAPGTRVLDSSDEPVDDSDPWTPIDIHISGVNVLPREVYLDVLRLPARARATPAVAKLVESQLLEFLQRTGFELANVEATVAGKGIDIEINEGQIERIIFVGRLSFKLVRFKLALSLPFDVFNRPMLDRQVQRLSSEMNLSGVRWELIRTAPVPHLGPQLEELPKAIDISVGGAPLVHARRPYELRVILPEDDWGRGLGLDVRTSYMDGVEVGLNEENVNLIHSGDRWRVAASTGLGARSQLVTGKLYAHLSRSALQGRYDLPQLLGRLRPELEVDLEWLMRERPDLYLEDYSALTSSTQARLQYQIRPELNLTLGVGFEWRRLYGFEFQPGLSPDLQPAELNAPVIDRKWPFARVTMDYVVDPHVNRWDRRHALEAEAREYVPAGEPGLGWLDARYQYIRAFGWHDLWVRSRVHISWGDVTFHDELSVGELTRGVFGDQFVSTAANAQLEFRYSIIRDELKVSFFEEVVGIETQIRTLKDQAQLGKWIPQLIDAFGPGLDFLVQDMFQLDMYVAMGVTRNAHFGAAFFVQVQKAF